MPDTASIAGAPFVTQPQPFDSEMLGRPVGRLGLPDGVPAADLVAMMPALAAGWREGGFWLVSCRVAEIAGATAPGIGSALRHAGFRHVETLVTLTREIGREPTPLPDAIETGTPDDSEICAEIGAIALTTSRYNADARIDPAAASRLKAQWVRNAFAGRADAILCARDSNGRAQGFNLLLQRADEAVIDLIAVAPAAQRRGFGRRLVMAGLAHYAGRARRMRVGTQAVNTASLALYRACGFAEEHRAQTWHWIADAA